MRHSAAGRGAFTLLLGMAGGALFLGLAIPLPWVLGSLAATALYSRTGRTLSLPGAWRGYAMAVIGTLLGAGFDTATLAAMPRWSLSLLVMALLSGLFLVLARAALRRWARMAPLTALLAALPGGLSLVSALAESYGADSRRVALCHTARLVALLVLTPLLLGLVADYDLAGASRQLLVNPWSAPWPELLGLAGVTLGGYALGRWLRLPSAQLLVPLLLSALVHAAGWVEAAVPGPVALLAQVVIGAGVGVRFCGYPLGQILRDGWLAALIGAALALLSLGAALALEALSGMPAAPLLLAFLPGGAPELGTVALALGIDPAMVAAHHVVRVLLIAALLPLLVRRQRGRPVAP